MTVTTSSEAARELSVLGHEAQRRKGAAIRRILRAYRRLNYAHAGRSDIDLLVRLADELEAKVADEQAEAS